MVVVGGGLGTGVELDPHQHDFSHLKFLSASPSLAYGGSLRWTTWSSKSTISSHKIGKNEILDIGLDTVQCLNK